MSKANANLVNSMVWNLREITDLVSMVKDLSGDVKCSSWRHPLVPCGELNVLQLLEDSRDSDRYTYLLELTFDRLIYLLNLIVKYMETSDESLAKFRPGKNVERPPNLSLSSVLYMVWDRIRDQTETTRERRTVQKSPARSVSCTWTQSVVDSTCSSCELAQSMVTQIVLKLEKFLGENSALMKERKSMQKTLLSTSNWSAMKSWVNAVLADLTAVCEEIDKFKAENVELRNRIETCEANLEAKTKKQEEDARVMKKIFNEKEDAIKSAERKAISLREDFKVQIAEFRKRNSELLKDLTELETKRKALEEKLAMNEKAEENRSVEWEEKLNAEIKKRESLLDAMESMKASLSDCEDRNKAEIRVLLEKIRTLESENVSMTTLLAEKQKELDDSLNKLLEAFPDISEDNKIGYKGTGNPMVDMRHQIEANKVRITQLMLANENLAQTINRIESIKK